MNIPFARREERDSKQVQTMACEAKGIQRPTSNARRLFLERPGDLRRAQSALGVGRFLRIPDEPSSVGWLCRVFLRDGMSPVMRGRSPTLDFRTPAFAHTATSHAGHTCYEIVSRPGTRQHDAVRYRIEVSQKARERLRALPKDLRRTIGQRMEAMRDDLHGDVRKLKDKGHRYRLRVGPHRILFALAGDAVQVYAVKDRKEADE